MRRVLLRGWVRSDNVSALFTSSLPSGNKATIPNPQPSSSIPASAMFPWCTTSSSDPGGRINSEDSSLYSSDLYWVCIIIINMWHTGPLLHLKCDDSAVGVCRWNMVVVVVLHKLRHTMICHIYIIVTPYRSCNHHMYSTHCFPRMMVTWWSHDCIYIRRRAIRLVVWEWGRTR